MICSNVHKFNTSPLLFSGVAYGGFLFSFYLFFLFFLIYFLSDQFWDSIIVSGIIECGIERDIAPSTESLFLSVCYRCFGLTVQVNYKLELPLFFLQFFFFVARWHAGAENYGRRN